MPNSGQFYLLLTLQRMSRPSRRPTPSRRTRKDPYAAREAEHYARPVPSREFILEYLGDCGPRTVEEIGRALGVGGDGAIFEEARIGRVVADNKCLHQDVPMPSAGGPRA